MDEPLMHKTPKGEFETLIWERHMNKELLKRISTLKQEMGVLQSEKDEAIHNARAEVDEYVQTMRKHNLGQLTLRNKKLKNLNTKKDEKIRELKRTNDDMMTGYIRLQQKIRGKLEKEGVLLEDNVDESTS